MPGSCAYNTEWEKEFPWISVVLNDGSKALCKIYSKMFKIDNSGIAQVKSHAKSHELTKKKEASSFFK